ncbi:MAG TPA: transketolase C-terminal domain-containing protein [Candidatus Paceibacterota bacterium]|nr:transketolase C-terminal domain-containing protein [Candidatus Paceibacterota bacterium]
MLVPSQKLHSEVLKDAEQAYTRDGFGEALLELGETNKDVVALCADLAESTRMLPFKEKYPDRYIELGVAEQNLAAVASGLANYGKVPFIASYATFSPGRNNEQIRTTISLNNVPVKIVGSHAGLSVGPDGATHQALEDLALMRTQPNMTVVSPADREEARKAAFAAAAHPGPVYIRLAREKTPVITTRDTPFEFGKAELLWLGENPQVAVFATGPLLHNALRAAKILQSEIAVSVFNVHTIKPLDEKTVVKAAQSAGAVVTVEEHQVASGFGSAIAELLVQTSPVPMEFIGVRDRFGQSGRTGELYKEYKLTELDIAEAIRAAFARKF